jgi:hypothetical protein
LLSSSEEETLPREAGFGDVEWFYAALSFRGWLAGEAISRLRARDFAGTVSINAHLTKA